MSLPSMLELAEESVAFLETDEEKIELVTSILTQLIGEQQALAIEELVRLVK